jgi:hypothetical protein
VRKGIVAGCFLFVWVKNTTRRTTNYIQLNEKERKEIPCHEQPTMSPPASEGKGFLSLPRAIEVHGEAFSEAHLRQLIEH